MATAGRASGSATRRNVCQGVQPSRRLTSSTQMFCSMKAALETR